MYPWSSIQLSVEVLASLGYVIQASLIRCWMVQKDWGSYLDSVNSTEASVLEISYWLSLGSSLSCASFLSLKSWVCQMPGSLDVALRYKWGC